LYFISSMRWWRRQRSRPRHDIDGSRHRAIRFDIEPAAGPWRCCASPSTRFDAEPGSLAQSRTTASGARDGLPSGVNERPCRWRHAVRLFFW
jgi:hypothetical protein